MHLTVDIRSFCKFLKHFMFLDHLSADDKSPTVCSGVISYVACNR